VITMGALGGPPEEIGHKVAAALVGTFLGILLRYGFLGPIASNMAKATEDEHAFYHVIRVVIVSFIKGPPPAIAVEFGRRAIPGHVRPTFQELEKHIKGRRSGSRLENDMPGPPLKKIVAQGGHRGGAWKVAYADFVTAMMALFIVLWLLNSIAKVQKAVGGVFQGPFRYFQKCRNGYGWRGRKFCRQQRQYAGPEGAIAEGHWRSTQIRQTPEPHRHDSHK
jgi:hypothetical protein